MRFKIGVVWLALALAAPGCMVDVEPDKEPTASVSSATQVIPIPSAMVPNDPDEKWRKDLLDFMASFSANDFSLLPAGHFTLPPFDDTGALYANANYSSLSYPEKLEIGQGWIFDANTMPITAAVRIPNECFTLDYIQGDLTAGGPQHGIAIDRWIEPMTNQSTAGYGFLYAYDSDVNPYSGLAGARNRAAVIIALQLIKLDTMHKTRAAGNPSNYWKASYQTNPNSWTNHSLADVFTQCTPSSPQADCDDDWIAGTPFGHPPPHRNSLINTHNRPERLGLPLEDAAVEYMLIRDTLTKQQQQAFDLAFVRMANRMRAWGFNHRFMNMITPSVNALLIIAKLTQDPVAMADYLYAVNVVYNNKFYNAGYFADDTGWDAGYNGYNLLHAGRLVRLEHYLASKTNTATTAALPTIQAAYEAMYSLKAHLQILDPVVDDNRPNGSGAPHLRFQYTPNHFSSRTHEDATWGQGGKRIMAINGIANGVSSAFPFLRGWDPNDYEVLNQATYNVDTRTLRETFGANYYTDRLNLSFASGAYSPPLLTCSTQTATCAPGDGCCPVGCKNSNDSDCYTGVRAWDLPHPERLTYYRPSTELLTHDPDVMTNWHTEVINNPDWEDYPIEKSGDAVRAFDDEFAFAKFGDFAVMIHTGRVGSYEDSPVRYPCVPGTPGCVYDNGTWLAVDWDLAYLPAGYGGGGLSYFWSADSGGAIVSRRKSRYDKGVNAAEGRLNMDDWSRQETWPLHRVLLTTDDGRTTTSARILDPARAIQPIQGPQGPVGLAVSVKGLIPWGSSRWGNGTPDHGPNVLSENISYKRSFWVDASGVQVTTLISAQPNQSDSFSSIVETIPLHGYSDYRQLLWDPGLPPIQTLFYISGNFAPTTAVPGQWIDNVYRVEHIRFGDVTRIDFATPERVSLSDDWTHWNDATGTQSWMSSRTLLIDMLGNAGAASQPLSQPLSVAYTISAP